MRTRHQVSTEPIAGRLGDGDRDTYRLTSEIVFDGELAGRTYKLEVFVEGSRGTRIGVIATRPLLDAPFSTRCFLKSGRAPDASTPGAIATHGEGILRRCHGDRGCRHEGASPRSGSTRTLRGMVSVLRRVVVAMSSSFPPVTYGGGEGDGKERKGKLP